MPNVNFDITASVEVWCGGCGTGLCGNATAVDYKGVTVEPCPACLQAEYDRGYDAGHDDGFAEGQDAAN